MTEQEQLIQMRLVLLGDANDESQDIVFKMYLNNAKAVVLNTLFPFNKCVNDIHEKDFRLRNWQVRCAIELYKSADRNGVQSYSENGFSVSYLTSLISSSLLGELVPKAGCPKAKSHCFHKQIDEVEENEEDIDDNENQI